MLTEVELSFVREHLDFYGKLNDTEKENLDRAVSRIQFRKGASLRSKESECLGVLLVHTGALRAYIQSEDGREVTLYRLGPGELCILSASCILNSLTFDVSIDSDKDTEVFKINLGVFDELMKRNVWVENFSYKSAVERFSDVMWAMEQVLFMRFDKRLAIFLLDESARNKSDEVIVTHEEIAKYVGSAREVVSRMLKNFEAQGIVRLSRGSILIADRLKLKQLL
jgi:cAMP-binding proteins - catabolite gene activator and regulatory subunit of cAMP-dependent protein kinases